MILQAMFAIIKNYICLNFKKTFNLVFRYYYSNFKLINYHLSILF